MKYIIKSEDISCNHCKMSIEKEFSQNKKVSSAVVDVANKSLTIETELSSEEVLDILSEIGFEGNLI
jgi:copper chaperone